MNVSTNMAALQVTGAQVAQPGAAAPDAPNSAIKEFEAMFLTQMVDEMLKQVEIGDFGGGQAEENWRFFLAEAFSREIVDQGGAGLSASLERALSAYSQTREME
ncbi:hypothetical protein [Salipiger bermudensis]|uniref:Flagellar protein FlgJ N-terminal domain-containing protein n=1 Tax=Salipiger bermudensis (strain DSM 26914 / JCM 13377 / KCTC 12554 / HTCC2601) TaxID=314265 RepID=Q0FMI3_SALBH|nr:hypothetical protein [Salipiger bermudensis]EAU45415.1 hypothetical protein R2601_00445 [Salipiger bermudensis HTCC2601]MBR9893232.1 hypothetical protein [bacterium]MCA1287762.1 hypothetical protein [Salipiger bermudensis]